MYISVGLFLIFLKIFIYFKNYATLMKLLFKLSKENLNLSVTEVLRLLKPKHYMINSNYLFVTSRSKIFTRLGYTKSVYYVLGNFDLSDVCNLNFSSRIDWPNIIKGSFKITVKNVKDNSTKQLLIDKIYDDIASKLNKHNFLVKVNLKNPDTLIELLALDNKVYILKHLWQNNDNYNARKSHNRPMQHPTSLHPKLAKACINLTGKVKGAVLDPFCGTGGILIEAGLLGFEVIGYDIVDKMLNNAKINLEHYGISNYVLIKNDARHIKHNTTAIVTDVPYGKSSFIDTELNKLLRDFLISAYTHTSVMVLMLPDFVNLEAILSSKCLKWKIINSFSYYLHKSLTKKIYILEK